MDVVFHIGEGAAKACNGSIEIHKQLDTTDWSEFQDKLIYKETENSSAKADVSSEVRDLESSVKSILQDDNLQLKASLEYYKTDYTELVLAMIQVLAENCGVIGGDGENNSGKKFKQCLQSLLNRSALQRLL